MGFWDGRDAVVASLQALAEAGPSVTSTVIATRGERLALCRIRSSRPDTRRWELGNEILHIVEIDSDKRITAHIELGPGDLDAAFAELDARYLAGEAAANAHTWSVVAGSYAAGLNRHELPAWTAGKVDIDHRSTTSLAPGELPAYIHAMWRQTPNVRVDIVAVHRLTSFGALVTHVATGTTEQGFEGEWREITLSTVEGDRISRSEMFDEAISRCGTRQIRRTGPARQHGWRTGRAKWRRAARRTSLRGLERVGRDAGRRRPGLTIGVASSMQVFGGVEMQ